MLQSVPLHPAIITIIIIVIRAIICVNLNPSHLVYVLKIAPSQVNIFLHLVIIFVNSQACISVMSGGVAGIRPEQAQHRQDSQGQGRYRMLTTL